MNTWGGPRSGAGRKTKAERHATAIDQAEAKVCDHLPQLVDHMLKLAYGIKQTRKTPQGKVEVYDVPPNYKALAYLIDRIMGKATERQEISGPDGGNIEISPFLLEGLERVYGKAAIEDADTAAAAMVLQAVNSMPEESMN